MTNNDYVGMEFPNEIAAHECGHVVALAAAGLADEFISATIVPQYRNDVLVLGSTDRSGASLTKLHNEHLEHIAPLAAGRQDALEAFRDFVLTTPDVCLPHICFFVGGVSIDRLLGREDTIRNRIDTDCIRQMVMPAMHIPSLSDEDLALVQDKVDEFLFNVFKKEKVLFDKIYTSLVERGTLDRNSIDPLVLKEMQSCAIRSAEKFKCLLAWVKEWHSGKVNQLPYF